MKDTIRHSLYYDSFVVVVAAAVVVAVVAGKQDSQNAILELLVDHLSLYFIPYPFTHEAIHRLYSSVHA